MRKILILLTCVFAATFIGCSDSNKVKDATENYLNANGKAVAAMSLLESINGKQIPIKVKIINWNETPIDTITKEDFYTYELRKRIHSANEYKLTRLHMDSAEVRRWQRDLSSCYSGSVKDIYEDFLTQAKKNLNDHQKEYQRQVDQINNIEELAKRQDKDDVLYLVYQFTERVSFVHPTSGEKVHSDNYGFSYADQILQAITFVEEGETVYVPKYEKLQSPVIIQHEQEDEVLL